MSNGWTGGQYSVYRAVFGLYLLQHFALLLPWAGELASNQGVLPDKSASPILHLFPNVLALIDSPAAVVLLVAAGAALSVAFLAGWKDRWAALGLWYVWACLFGRNPLIANPSLPFVGWLLLAHACLPRAPFGSAEARGRLDPGGGWRLDSGIFLAAWIVMALGYSYSGWTKLISPSWLDGSAIARVLENPLARPGFAAELLRALPEPLLRLSAWSVLGLELFFAPLALSKRLRPWLWGVMLAMHLGLIVLIDFADLSLGMVVLHLFTFDPSWLAPARSAAPDLLFYDGGCGLCHGFVRFVLAEDRSGAGFRFAPLGGSAFESAVPAQLRASLPDSLVLTTADGELLTRSAAVARILIRLGGLWRIAGEVLRLAPRCAADALYDAAAAARRRIFSTPSGPCPLLPSELRQRFI